MEDKIVIKIATLDEAKDKWDYEIKNNPSNPLYIIAANECLREIKKGTRIPYILKLNNQIICDLTIIIKEKGILREAKYTDDLVSDKRVYMCCVRTNEEYQGKGYFSKLYKYVENDLKEKGYKEISLSVDITKAKNTAIYTKYGFTNYLRTEVNRGFTKDYIFNYYYKKIDI